MDDKDRMIDGTDEESGKKEIEPIAYSVSRYNAYVEERTALKKTGLEISGRYDRGILLLPGGALVLSLTFLEKFAPDPSPRTKYLLGISWLLLIAALLAGMVGVLSSQYSIDRQIAILDDDYLKFRKWEDSGSQGSPPSPRTKRNVWNRMTNTMNWISLVTLVLGISSLCGFAFINFHEHRLPFAPQSTNVLKQFLSNTNTTVTVTNR